MSAWARCLMLAFGLFAALSAYAGAADPPVPAGSDSGGRPIAILCGGLDYTRDGIAARLARDGEGEIIGYDFIDDDRLPYAKDESGVQSMADILLGEGQATSLIVVRADTGLMQPLSQALLYASKSPARIIVIDAVAHERDATAVLASAVRHFSDRLFVIGAGDEDRDLDQEWAAALRNLPNLLIVAPVLADGSAVPGSNTGALTIDIATTGSALKGEGTTRSDAPGASLRSAGHIAALAARLRAVEPDITAASLKQRIVGLADGVPAPDAAKTLHGTIRRPDRYFWLE